MNVPSGYSALDLVGFTDKGDYSASANYVKNDLVHYNDKIWKCLIDDTTGIAPTTGVNWDVWIDQSNSLDGLADVEITNAQDGQELSYDGTTQKWKNTSKIQTLTNQVKDMNNVYGSKNILPVTIDNLKALNTSGSWNGNAYTYNGVTYTVTLENGAVKKIDIYSTGATGASPFELYGKNGAYDVNVFGDKKLSGCTDGNQNKWQIICSTSANADGSSATTTRQTTTAIDIPTSNYVRIYAVVSAGQAVNTSIYPMVCEAVFYSFDPTYAPYAKTNQQLTEDTTALLDNLEVNGAVNILNNTATTTTKNGVTFTVNDDKSVSVNSTNGATADYTPLVIPFQVEETGQYRVLLDKDGTSNGSIYYTVESVNPSPAARITRSYDGNEVVTLTKGTYYTFVIYCRLNVPIADKLVQPFITDLLSYNGPYVPYAKSNRELTEDVKELTVTTGEIARLVSFSSLTAYYVRKYGKVVELCFAGTVSEAVNRWTDFLTVPDGFRPSNYVQIVSFNTYNSCKNLQLVPSGGIQSADNLAVDDFVRFTVTYIID